MQWIWQMTNDTSEYGLTPSWTLLFHAFHNARGGSHLQTPVQAKRSHPVVQMYQQKDQRCTREGLQNQLCITYAREYLGESAFWNCTGRIKYSLGQTGTCNSVRNTLSTAILSLDNRKEHVTSSSILYVSSTKGCMHGAEASVHSKVMRNSRGMLLLLHSLGYQWYHFLRLCSWWPST